MGLSLKRAPTVSSTQPGPRTTVPIDDCVPNTWNMNKLDPVSAKKLKAWLQRSLKNSGRIALPVAVRPHPIQPGKWEIIDGEHRWRSLKELGETEVDIYPYHCDDKDARLLTDALNYLRGSPDEEKEVTYLKDLMRVGTSLEEIAAFTHSSREELDQIINDYDIKVEEVEIKETDAEKDAKEKDEWVEMKFAVPSDAAVIVEAELARISDQLTGKNLRGRALEFMAVQSAQTPLDAVAPATDEGRTSTLKKKLAMKAGKGKSSG